jgi:hypothetical protein
MGRSMEQCNYLDIMKLGESDCILTINCNADFSGHDNEVKEEQVILAFAVLRLCFPKQWKFMDKLFYYCASSMINKNLVLPESNLVYKITKGIATGHPFTSLVNTICAYTTFATAIYKVCNQEEINLSRLWVAGDDVLCKLPLNKLNDIAYELSNNSGMKISNLSDSSGPLISNNHLYNISFLKKKFMNHGIGWNDIELISNLINSYSGRKTSMEEIDRIINMLMNGPCDFDMNERIISLINLHFVDPRFKVIDLIPPYLISSMFDPPNSKMLCKTKRKKFFDDSMRKSVIKRFNSYMRLAFRWFNVAQPFAALGKKNDSYWIDATKICYPVEGANHGYLLKRYLFEQYSVKWQ